MANVSLEFKASAGDSEPQNRPVLIVGQLGNLQQLQWAQVQGKLQPAVTKEVLLSVCHPPNDMTHTRTSASPHFSFLTLRLMTVVLDYEADCSITDDG